MNDALKYPISQLVIGEEWLVKVVHYLENETVNDRIEKTNTSYATFLQRIKNVIDIFEEIESDLVHTENKIHETRRTVYTLGNQFDRLGRFCLNEIPFVVQKEHDQASNNLTALRWNIKKTQEEYNKVFTRLRSLAATKKSIENEISQLTGCTSLVNEKSLITETELKGIIDRTTESRQPLFCISQNEISKFRKSIELLESRLLTAQDLLQVSNTDYNRTQLKHSSVKDDLELTKSRTRTEQDEKQNMLKYLQHKIDEECQIKSKLMIDLENNLIEFEKIKQDGYQKRLELEATVKQLDSNFENVKSELEAIRLNHNYYLEQLNIKQNEYKQFENEWNEEYSTMCNKVQTLDESLLKSKTQFSELKTRLEGMTNEKNFLQEKQNKLKLSLLALMKVKLRGTTKLSQLRCTVADLTKTNKTLVSEIDILKRQTEQMNQLQTKRELQLSNLMKARDLVLKKLKEDLKEKLSLNLTLSDQYIKMQEEQSKLLSLFYLAVTNSVLDQNQLFNAEQLLVLWARILRQRNYWELKLQAKQETKVNDLLNHNYQINQQINEIKEINTNMKPLLSLEYKT
ncbi:putative spindle assembly checkpoint component MAD1 (Mitotic arrest deficient protein 1) [Schistosoma mansoni]|uniref:putative spindle assembly checkpoint component MAD1 (Mitotic arrest deficient protein 1) n=1 Tax=Schistosoma mansoni TaxID=6183 RepID=UPI0001A6335A|nr:putative spindle assembly checkpoint component MAD1 (Mitotic arrest deficient protein 1) [Schistosoma mansoni]|eukprot:XP_018655338.1 putative spindle assembly checkpoint component MAD1 (Mitotic arrest deficient protein 1) [Schistosoma mansoni]